ncbi:MAG: hypothetical protein KAR35_00615 [Candidatus Heimdallarchaeota archaeon]|nr:hypothetical protein [Candidatus Heimdallarchaeota archaeon]MCK5047854.1 hypothetical protein [Candidatus Heimdallarchaeota archaeon]
MEPHSLNIELFNLFIALGILSVAIILMTIIYTRYSLSIHKDFVISGLLIFFFEIIVFISMIETPDEQIKGYLIFLSKLSQIILYIICLFWFKIIFDLQYSNYPSRMMIYLFAIGVGVSSIFYETIAIDNEGSSKITYSTTQNFIPLILITLVIIELMVIVYNISPSPFKKRRSKYLLIFSFLSDGVYIIIEGLTNSGVINITPFFSVIFIALGYLLFFLVIYSEPTAILINVIKLNQIHICSKDGVKGLVAYSFIERKIIPKIEEIKTVGFINDLFIYQPDKTFSQYEFRWHENNLIQIITGDQTRLVMFARQRNKALLELGKYFIEKFEKDFEASIFDETLNKKEIDATIQFVKETFSFPSFS